VVWGVVMVGSLGDTSWSGFCTGNCIATCTGFGMTARSACWDKMVFADAVVNSIQYQWYCMDTQQVYGRLDGCAIQGWAHHG